MADTSLIFNIIGRDRGASRALRDVGAGAQDAERDLDALKNAQLRSSEAQLKVRKADLDLAAARKALDEVTKDESATEEQRERALLRVETATLRHTKAVNDAAKAARQLETATLGQTEASRKATKATDAHAAAAGRAKSRLDKLNESYLLSRTGISGMTTAALALGPAILPTLAGATVAAGSLSTALIAGGAAGGVFGIAAKGIADRLKEVIESTEGVEKAIPKAFQPAVQAFNGMRGAWDRFLDAAQPATLRIFTDGMNMVAAALPKLVPLFNVGAAAVSAFMKPVREFVTGGGLNQAVAFLASQAGPVLTSFSNIVMNLARTVGNLVVAFMPMSRAMVGGLEGMTAAMARWSAGLAGSAGFQKFLDLARVGGASLVATFRSIGAAVVNLVVALTPIGVVALNVAQAFAKFLAAIPPERLGAMAAALIGVAIAMKTVSASTAAFKAVAGLAGGPVTAVLVALVALGAGMLYLYRNSETVRAGLAQFASFVSGTLMPGLRQFGASVLSALSAAWAQVSAAISRNRPQLMMIGQAIGMVASVIASKVIPILGVLYATQFRVFGSVVALLIDVIGWVVRFGTAIVGGIAVAVGAVVRFGQAVAAGFMVAVGAVVRFGQAVAAGFMAAVRAVVGFGAAIVSGVVAAFSFVRAAVMAGIAVVAGVVRAGMGLVAAGWRAVWGLFGPLVMAVFGLVRAVIGLGMAVVTGVIRTGLAAIQAVWSAVFNTVRSVTSSVFNAIRSVVMSVVGFLWPYVTTAWNAIRSAITTAVNAVRSVVSSVFNAIRSVVTSVIGSVRSAVVAGFNAVRSAVASAVNAARSAVTGAFGGMRSSASSTVGNMVSTVRGMAGRILSAVAGFGKLLFRAGASLIQGLIDGVTSKIGALTSKISALTAKVKNFFPGSPVKVGPLRVLNRGYAGGQIPLMLAQGVESGIPALASASRAMANAVHAPAAPSAPVMGGAGVGLATTGGVGVSLPGGGSQPIHITLKFGDRALGELILDPLRKTVHSLGGNVQAVLGR